MTPAFPNIDRIEYEGPDSNNLFSFRWYNADELIEGRSMKEHMRFSITYWHTFRGTGSDPFGAGTMVRPWEDGTDSVENACNRARVAFEFIEKIGAPYYAFHDRDVAPEGATLAESNRNLDAVVAVLKEEQERTGIKLLWGTATMHEPRVAKHVGGAPQQLDPGALLLLFQDVDDGIQICVGFG